MSKVRYRMIDECSEVTPLWRSFCDSLRNEYGTLRPGAIEKAIAKLNGRMIYKNADCPNDGWGWVEFETKKDMTVFLLRFA